MSTYIYKYIYVLRHAQVSSVGFQLSACCESLLTRKLTDKDVRQNVLKKALYFFQ